MGKNKLSMSFSGFEDLAAKLDELGGDEALKRGVEAGLMAAKADADKSIKKAMSKSNLPAHGKYSTGESLKAIYSYSKVEWQGTEASVTVGFDRDISLTPAFLINGVPGLYSPVPGLKQALRLNAKRRKMITSAMAKVVKRKCAEPRLGKGFTNTDFL